MSKKEWLQEALAVVLGMGAIFAAAASSVSGHTPETPEWTGRD